MPIATKIVKAGQIRASAIATSFGWPKIAASLAIDVHFPDKAFAVVRINIRFKICQTFWIVCWYLLANLINCIKFDLGKSNELKILMIRYKRSENILNGKIPAGLV